MPRDKIVCNGMTFTEEKLNKCSIFLSNSISNSELGIDTLNAGIDFSDEIGTIFAPADADGLLTSDKELFTVRPYFRVLLFDADQFKYGDKIEYYRNNVLFSVFYIDRIKRTSRYIFEISCVSAIGRLDSIKHYGGLYTGQKFSQVVGEIIGNIVPYSISENVKNIRVYGWLPVSTCRDNLRQLLFAYGVSVKKDENRNILFSRLTVSSTKNIPQNRVMLGGSVDYPDAISNAIIYEHRYFKTDSDEIVTIYDGEILSSSITTPKGEKPYAMLITFSGPMYGLEINGDYCSILESGPNYVVIYGSGFVLLTGRNYMHTTREVYRYIQQGSYTRVGEKKEARVEKATLVNPLNSDSVADRVASYYSSVRKIKSNILVGNERPGDNVRITDPFMDIDVGLLSSMDIKISKNIVANVTVDAGYIPATTTEYENRVLLTGSGVFEVPAGVTRLHLILVGAGQGGYSGVMGNEGEADRKSVTESGEQDGVNSRKIYKKTGTGGAGGPGGLGGKGGQIEEVTINVSPGERYEYSCGIGGSGGISQKDRNVVDYTSYAGKDGGITDFGQQSSAFGKIREQPYVDIMTGEYFGGTGTPGVRGGKGGGFPDGDNYQFYDQSRGQDVSFDGKLYIGGNTNPIRKYRQTSISCGQAEVDGKTVTVLYSFSISAYYGCGGGAAVGSNGTVSTKNGYFDIEIPYTTATFVVTAENPSAAASACGATAYSGYGGKGGDAKSPGAETRYGYGGPGGHGGGGAGAPGAVSVEAKILNSTNSESVKLPARCVLEQITNNGEGDRSVGLGSNGGKAGDGCIIVYY